MQFNYINNQDCLDGMRLLPNSSIDLIYLDPRFFTQRTHQLSNRDGEEFSFSDSWVNKEAYMEFLRVRLHEMHRILKNTGNIFVHCDRTASHLIRILLEEIFGSQNFRSEIIWSYKRWSNAKKGLLDAHQNIYHFSKSANFKFNMIYTDYSPTTNVDQILQDRVRNAQGKTIYKRDETGEVINTRGKKGVPLSDVWEIPFLNPKAKERVGYPTQKPIQLLENIINIASDPEDIVLDPFLGSGTTAVAAHLLGRKYIGFDINEHAIKLAHSRLANPIKTESRLLQKGLNQYDTKSQTVKRILNRYDCDIVQRNRGLDAILREKIDGKLVGIKVQQEQESLATSEQLLQQALSSKQMSLGILVRTHVDLSVHEVASNIILVDDIDYLLACRKLNFDSTEN